MERSASKGQSTEAIIFVILLIASLIIAVWYLRNVNPDKKIIGDFQEDLHALESHVLNACSSGRYTGHLSLFTTEGNLSISNQKVCMETPLIKDCFLSACPMSNTQLIIKGKTTVDIVREDGQVIITER